MANSVDDATAPRPNAAPGQAKAWLYMLGFGLVGLVFEWSMPFVGEFIRSVVLRAPAQPVCHAVDEDAASYHLLVYFLIGGALFFALWAWIGRVAARDWRRAGGMIAGVALATCGCAAALAWAGPCSTAFTGNDARSVVIWAVACAGLAFGMGRLAEGRTVRGASE